MLFDYKGIEVKIDSSLLYAVSTIRRGECVLEHSLDVLKAFVKAYKEQYHV